jgi:hypothetical protein
MLEPKNYVDLNPCLHPEDLATAELQHGVWRCKLCSGRRKAPDGYVASPHGWVKQDASIVGLIEIIWEDLVDGEQWCFVEMAPNIKGVIGHQGNDTWRGFADSRAQEQATERADAATWVESALRAKANRLVKL